MLYVRIIVPWFDEHIFNFKEIKQPIYIGVNFNYLQVIFSSQYRLEKSFDA